MIVYSTESSTYLEPPPQKLTLNPLLGEKRSRKTSKKFSTHSKLGIYPLCDNNPMP